MGKHSAPSRRSRRTHTEDHDLTTEIPRVTEPLPPVPARRARRRVAAATVALASTVAVGIAVAPDFNAEDEATQPIPALVDIVEPEQPFADIALVAATRARHEAEQQAAAQIQEAAETAAIASRRAQEVADAERAAEAARVAQEAREAAEAAAAAEAAEEKAEEVAAEQPEQSAANFSGSIVPGARMTSGYGARWGTFHYGIDLAAPLGTPIYTPFSGTVVHAGASSGFGNTVQVLTEEGDVILFGHMRTLTVSEGERVNAGDLVAYVGNEGQSTGPHCHVEIHLGGQGGTKTSPIPYLAARGVSV